MAKAVLYEAGESGRLGYEVKDVVLRNAVRLIVEQVCDEWHVDRLRAERELGKILLRCDIASRVVNEIAKRLTEEGCLWWEKRSGGCLRR